MHFFLIRNKIGAQQENIDPQERGETWMRKMGVLVKF